MQKLQEELKNTPRNTSLVPCSVSSGLNKEETLSDQNIVLTCNNSEENLRVSCSRTKLESICRKNSTILIVHNIKGRQFLPRLKT